MAKESCRKCGRQHPEATGFNNGICSRCTAKMQDNIGSGSTGGIIVTTECASDLRITERLGIITAECVLGMHFFKELVAGLTDVFGGRSKSLQRELKKLRETAIDELRAEAFSIGADAVVAVDLDYSEISGGGKTMLFLVASGTAVRLDKSV